MTQTETNVKPNYRKVNPENIPAEMKGIPHWVVWRGELRGGKWTKPPYDAKTRRDASTKDPSTWTDFDTALSVYQGGGYDGIGFVLTKPLSLVGFDFDHCMPGGEITPEVQGFLDQLQSYTEFSPTDGIRALAFGKKPGYARCKIPAKGYEVYETGRYLTITGHSVNGHARIEKRQPEIEAVCRAWWPEEKKTSTGEKRGASSSVDMDDQELLEKALRDDKFQTLYSGDTSGYGSQSEADLALCSKLAFWTGRDAGRMDQFFRSSGLMRDKWGGKHGKATYGQMTIEKAIAGCTNTYDPRYGRGGDDFHRGGEDGPMQLQRALEEQSPCPIDSLPDVLKGAVLSLHGSIKAPIPLCMQSVLAAAALAVQGRANVIIDGRIYPLSENFLTIGESGERKSAVDKQALRPHTERQKELKEEYDLQFQDYYIEVDSWKKSREEALKKGKTHGEKQDLLRELGPEPEQPIGYVLKTDEATFQGLFRLLQDGQPSIGLFSDEGGRLLGGYSMAAENKLQMVAGLSNLWDGEPLGRSTGGNGTAILYGKRLSTHLLMQRQVASSLLCDPMVRDQGFLSRCLVAYPQTTIGTREYSQTDLTKNPAMRAYWKKLKDILELPLLIAENTKNDLSLPNRPLSRNAKRLWIDFHNLIEKQMADGGRLECIRDLGSKLPEHAARLAGTLSLVEDINAHEIGEEAMANGIELADFYLQEAIRIRGGLEPDPELDLAQEVLDFLHKKWMPKYGKYLCLVPLYQEGPTGIRTAKKARESVRILEDHGWLVKQDGPKKVCGKTRKEVWEVRNG